MAYVYKDPHFFFEDNGHAEYFATKRHSQAAINAQARMVQITIDHTNNRWVYGDAWTEADELKLVDKLWRDWFDEPYGGMQQYPDLDLDSLEAKPLRKNELRPFRIEYETYSEIKLRLLNTLISIKGHPFTVNRVIPTAGNFGLVVSDGSKNHFVRYKDLTDLRTLPPKYIAGNMHQYTGWLCRTPQRVYQQGINRNNTMIKSVTGENNLSTVDISALCKSLRKEQDRRWSETHKGLLQTQELTSLRLTDDIAVTWDGEDILACYRGRKLGTVQSDDILVMDEDDLLQGWIETSAKKAGFNLAA